MLARLLRYHSRFLDSLIPPKLRKNNSDLMRCRILAGLIFYITLVDSLMGLVRLITSGLTTATLVTLVAIPVFCSLFLVFWLTCSRKLTGDILVLIAIVVISITAWGDGGLYARTIFWFPTVPLVANFLAGRIRSLWSTIICWAVLLSMFYAHKMQWLHSFDEIDPLGGRLSASMASVLFVAIISYLYEDSHQRAEEERNRFDQSKSNWVSMVSHELRTPLTAIYGSLGLLLANKNSHMDSDAVNMVTIANSNCQRLVRLVNDVLDIEKIESGQLALNKSDATLTELIREVELINRDLAKKHHVNIKVENSYEELIICVDADRIVQALQNIVSNAIKFSPENSVVIVRLEKFADEIRLSVIDAGAGIDPEFHDKVFTRFAQADDVSIRKQGGSGLGLNISQSIIEQHNGKIGYYNNPDKGVTFYFTLPL